MTQQWSPGTLRRRRRGALLLCLLLPAGCGPPLPAGAPAEEATDAPLPSRAATDLPISPDETPLDLRLDALLGGAPEPGGRARNPFRFTRAAPRPLMPAAGVSGGNPAITPGGVDGWRLAAAADAVRFLGVLEAPESVGRVAVVTDGAGVYHGRVGDVVGGRYRIVAIDRTAMMLERVEDGERMTLERSDE